MLSAPRLRPARIRAGAVRDAATTDLGVILRDLETWVALDSPSGDIDALNGLAGVLASSLTAYGWETDLVPAPAGLHLHARLHGRGRARVALLCHHDTVFPRGTAAARPLSLRDGRAHGPGVADMKGGVAVAAHAGRLLAAQVLDVGLLELVSVPDEEIRSEPFATIDRLAGFDAVFVMECGRPGNGIVTARKGGRWVDVHAAGRAAHAGTEPHLGRNAVLALCAEALRIAALDGLRDGVTVQVTQLHGGEVINAVPAAGTLTFDVRALHAADLDAVLAEVARFGTHDGVTLRLVTGDGTPPLEATPATTALVARAQELGAALGEPVAEIATGGVSDGCWTAAAGLPTLDGLGPVGGLDHTAEEYVELDSIPLRCGLLAGLVTAVEEGLP